MIGSGYFSWSFSRRNRLSPFSRRRLKSKRGILADDSSCSRSMGVSLDVLTVSVPYSSMKRVASSGSWEIEKLRVSCWSHKTRGKRLLFTRDFPSNT